jgi:pilus assembly protein CpaB
MSEIRRKFDFIYIAELEWVMSKRFAGPNVGFHRRNERERLFFIAAAGLAFSLLIISLVVFNFRTDANAEKNIATRIESSIPKSLGTVTLYAPDRAIPQGMKLSEIKLKEVYWPHDQVPEGAVRDIAEIKAMYASENLRPLSPIARSMLSREPVQINLQPSPGYRALTIEVDAVSGVEGYIVPGSHVDIALTALEQGELKSRYLVQNVRVLSYGGVMKANHQLLDGPRQVSRTVTIEVTPTDVLTINVARKTGTLNLSMRDISDQKMVSKVEISENDIGRPGEAKARPKQSSSCGVVRVAGDEYVVPCNASGTLTKLDTEQVP